MFRFFLKFKGLALKGFLLLICIICLFSLLSLYLYRSYLDHDTTRYDSLIISTAEMHGLDPMLIKALIWRESRFRPNTVGKKGEIGLMQLMNSSVKDWSKHTKRKVPNRGILFSPRLNIEIGTWYLARSKKHWQAYGNNSSLALALAEYNAGYSNVKKWLQQSDKKNKINAIELIRFPKTKHYVRSILKKYDNYKKSMIDVK